MTNTLSKVFDDLENQAPKNPLVGRLLTPQEIEVVAGATSCEATGSSHSQGGGSYTQGPTGSYGQGGTGGGTYNQTC